MTCAIDPLTRADWLSIAQTAASVLAILGAFGVVFLQHALEKKRRKDEVRSQAEQYLTLARDFSSDAMRAVNETFEFRSDPANTETNAYRIKARSRVSQCLEALMALQIEKLPTVTATRQVIRARSELAYAMNIIDVNAFGPGGEVACGEEYGKPLSKIVARLQDSTKKLGEELAVFY